MLEKLFPTLSGIWRCNINLNKYAMVIQEDVKNNPFLCPDLFGEWIYLLHRTWNADHSCGGYGEDREHILNGTYLESGKRIHLGVDYWVPQNTPVHLPSFGKLVYSWIDKDQNGGWGVRSFLRLVNFITFLVTCKIFWQTLAPHMTLAQ